jgi:MFS family permease
MFSALAIRNARLFFAGHVISMIGTWISATAQPLFVLQLGAGALAVGLVAAVRFLPMLLLGPWAGAVVDRLDRRRLILVLQCASLAQNLVFVGLALWGATIPVVVLAVTAGGVIGAFDNPARRTFIGELVPPDRLSNVISLNSLVTTTSRTVGPAIAGVLIGLAGYTLAFSVNALSTAVALAMLLTVRRSEMHASDPVPRARKQVREGLRHVAGSPVLRTVLGVAAIVSTLAISPNVLIPLFVIDVFHGSENDYAAVLSALGAGMLAGAIVMTRLRLDRPSFPVWSALGIGVTTLALGASPSLPWAIATGALVGVATIAFSTSSSVVIQNWAGPGFRGRVIALQAVVVMGSTPIGAPTLSAIVEWGDARVAVWVAGASALLAAALGAGMIHRSRIGPDGHAAPQ